MSQFPQMFRLKHHFPRPRIEDIPGQVHRQLQKLQLGQYVRPGQQVAVTAGSRGIACIDQILKAVVDHLKSLGAEPFLVPAMGSHGGATAQGQLQVLTTYGITPQRIGCPIRATMDTVVLCRTPEGIPVHFDRYAYEADHVVIVGRIKPHTDFVGPIESGLMKMMLIGLGKHEGAKVYHRAIQDYSFDQILRSVAHRVMQSVSILAGVAIVENPYDETAWIEALRPQQFESREPELLRMAREWMPRLPFDQADVLIIDQIGKNISGSGMDTNVVGRKLLWHQPAPEERPKIKRIWIRSLTPETHGNAAGIGGAEFISRRVLEQIDLRVTKINCLTGGGPIGAMLPVWFDTEQEVFQAALSTVGLVPPQDARVMWIRDTLHVAEVECSQAYWEQAQRRDDLEVLTQPRPLQWTPQGDLVNRFGPVDQAPRLNLLPELAKL